MKIAKWIMAATLAAATAGGARADNTHWGDANCDGQTDMSDCVLIMQSLEYPDKYGANGSDLDHRITAQGGGDDVEATVWKMAQLSANWHRATVCWGRVHGGIFQWGQPERHRLPSACSLCRE